MKTAYDVLSHKNSLLHKVLFNGRNLYVNIKQNLRCLLPVVLILITPLYRVRTIEKKRGGKI